MEESVAVEPVKPAPPSAPAPIMDIKVPPSAQPVASAAPAVPPSPTPAGNKSVYADPAAAAAAKKATPKKSPATGVNAAIFATVVIVLGLAALAVYAYTKTK